MDDDLKDEVEESEDDFDDVTIIGKVNPSKKPILEDDDSLDALADEEDGILPEDSFDDEDRW